MNINIDLLIKNLSEYSSEANNFASSIAKGLLPLGVVIIAIFFLIELANWKHLLNRRRKSVTVNLWIEFAVKYFIGALLLFTSGYILDTIMELSILITKKVNEIYPPSSYSLKYTEVDYDDWFTKKIINFVGWILEKISNIIIQFLILMRYIDLYFLKAIAPIMIGFFFSDEFRPVVMNYFKTFIAYSLIGVVILIYTILFGLLAFSSEDPDATFTIFLGFVYILVLVGIIRKIKSLLGVQ